MKKPAVTQKLDLPIAATFCHSGPENSCQGPTYWSASPENAPVLLLFVNKTSTLSLFFEQTKTFLVGVYVPDGNVNFYIFQKNHFKFGSLTLYFHWLLYLNQNVFGVELNKVRRVRSKFAVTALTTKFLCFIISVERKDKFGPAAYDIAYPRESSWEGVACEACYVLKEIIGG